jgi:hypothetical protein
MRVARSGTDMHAGALTSVEALISDDLGVVVAHRTITDRSARVCLPLAHAVGAWASLVLDAEMNRATDDDGGEPGAGSSSGSTGSTKNSVGRASVGFAGTAPGGDPPFESGAPAHDHSATRAEGQKERPRSVELGAMVYLREGITTRGGVTGLAPFVTVEVADGWVLRPGVFFGSTARQGSTLLGHLGARADFCRRIPGNYVERRGIEADLCAGVEGGVITASGGEPEGQSTARAGIGPSANLRGELGAGLALEVRGLIGANLIPYAPTSPLLYASAEVGVSVRLP